MAPACDSFGIVHHGIKQFIRRAASSAVQDRHVLARETLMEIYRNAFSRALPDTLFKAELLETADQSLLTVRESHNMGSTWSDERARKISVKLKGINALQITNIYFHVNVYISLCNILIVS